MSAFYLLASVWLPAQSADHHGQPPHQPLWTCSSRLKCRNEMTCHPVGEVSLPFLDCVGRLCDRMCPRKRHRTIRFEGVDTSLMYPHHAWQGSQPSAVPECISGAAPAAAVPPGQKPIVQSEMIIKPK